MVYVAVIIITAVVIIMKVVVIIINVAVVIVNRAVIIVYMSYHDICNGLSSYKLWLIFRQVIVRLPRIVFIMFACFSKSEGVLCSSLDLFSGNFDNCFLDLLYLLSGNLGNVC